MTQLSHLALNSYRRRIRRKVKLLSVQLRVAEREVESKKTYPSYFRTITQLSLHTLHTAVTESVQGGGRLKAFAEKHTCS